MYKKAFLIILGILALCTSCTEKIDTSARYTFTQETVVSYLEKHPQYSDYLDIMGKVRLSRISETTVRQLLSARGHYTCFVPNNNAIQAYLQEQVDKGLIPTPSWDAIARPETRDSLYKVIVMNSIIDGENETTYETNSFPATNNGEFPLANMNDRKLTVRYGTNPDSIYINYDCPMEQKNRDIPVLNGVIHCMDKVVAPTNITMGNLIDDIQTNHKEGFLVMAKMVDACGLKDTLNKERDEVYEEKYQRGDIEDMNAQTFGWVFHGATGHQTAYAPQHRKYGFTLFAEKDEFWTEALGKAPADITAADIQKWVLDNHQYSDEDDFVADDNYTSPRNLLNQWTTYHLLPMKIPTNKLVFHINEKGFNPRSTAYTIPVMEYYTTMGARRLLKIYQSKESKGIFLNRFPTLDNGRKGSGHELYCSVGKEGCLIDAESDNVILYESVNGMIYGIDAPLAYTDEVRDDFMRSRIRFDAMSLFPEAMNNDIRKKESTSYKDQYVHIPNNTVYQYFENMDQNENCHFVYLNSWGYDWCNLQADELKACGQYEITIKLPPVPKTNTYELRYRVLPQPERGVIQFYFGSDKNHLVPTGIPIDLRIYGTNQITGWEADTGDEDYDAEIDKKMRNNNRMKGEESVQNSLGTARSSGNGHIYRYILTRQQLDPNKTYYLKMKSVLESSVTEFYMDYLEWCPKEIYGNPAQPEDIW